MTGRRSRKEQLNEGFACLLVADLDIVQPSVHPIHTELDTRHVQHKVRQVAHDPHI